MIKITLKDGSVKELAAPQSIADFTKDLSMGLYRNACCALVDGKVADLCDLLDHDCAVEILTFEDEQGQRAFNHTASHILAQAVQHLFPGVKLAIGPAIEDGFYYDFDVPTPFTPEDLEKLEAEYRRGLEQLRQARGPELARDSLEPLFRAGRDRLQSRSGMGCQVSSFRQVVQLDD